MPDSFRDVDVGGDNLDEASPALGRQSRLLEEQRQNSGGLSDDPIDNPVVDSVPFANLRGEGKP